MFKLTQVGPTRSDCTARYDLQFENDVDPNLRLRDFVEHILSKKEDEWGNISVLTQYAVNVGQIVYKHGQIVSSRIPAEVLNKRIFRVAAEGGWTRMDYTIRLKDPRDYIKLQETSAVAVMDATIMQIQDQDITLYELLDAITNGIMGENGDITILNDDGSEIESRWTLRIPIDVNINLCHKKINYCRVTYYPRSKTANFRIELEQEDGRETE